MKDKTKQHNLIRKIRQVLLKDEHLEKITLKNLQNMIGCLNLYCNSEFNLSHCQEAFKLPSSTYKRYVKKLEEGKSFIVKKRGPQIIVYSYDWGRINTFIKRSIVSGKQYWHVNKRTLYERVKNKFNLPKLSYSAFNKKVDLKKYQRRKKIRITYKRWEIATPGYIQMDGVNLNDPGLALKKSKHHIYTAIDCYSRVSFAYCYDEKCRSNSIDFANRAIKFFKKLGIKVAHIRTDNGAEFVHTRSRNHNNTKHRILSDFEIQLFHNGVNHDTTMPGYPNQNGKVERFNRSIVEEHISYMYEQYKGLSVEEINKCLESYIIYYNNRRHHSTLKTTPKETITNYIKYGVISEHVFNNEANYIYN